MNFYINFKYYSACAAISSPDCQPDSHGSEPIHRPISAALQTFRTRYRLPLGDVLIFDLGGTPVTL